eukprot:gnl/MRDRNA2_/MRDRNA2_98898_c0_seq1.p1 gnl/MRDRNA2_/MRDRNA2_98898_c0~~gnl/MRDRNA2_/MRDRNA2_98898_c0_seq1.p1  ORF type:complete len:420 (-),score=134.88 gnl/MRDRNA2_/MRDRNA2_98898_c0_seq1:73-1248(-)
MPAVKRSAQAKAPAAKRMKTDLEKNMDKVLSAVSDAETEVPCRAMFLAIADAVLKIPSSDRHENQTAVMSMMKEVFMAEKARWEGRIAEAQSVSDAAEQERTVKTTAKDDEDAKIKAHKEVVKGKKDEYEKASEVLNSCNEDLAHAVSTQSSATKAQMKIVSEREEALEVQKSFEVMKEGSCELPKESKMHLAAITSLFKALGVEDALVKTIPTVLCRKPSERGSFDEISVKQLETHLENHLADLAGKIEAAGVHVSEAQTAVAAWGAAVDLCNEKLGDCKAAVESAESTHGEMQAALVSARKALKDQNAVCKRTVGSLSAEQAGLSKTEAVLNSLEFLSQYETPAVPEDTMEKVTEQTMDESASKDAPCEKVITDVPSPSHKSKTMVESF